MSRRRNKGGISAAAFWATLSSPTSGLLWRVCRVSDGEPVATLIAVDAEHAVLIARRDPGLHPIELHAERVSA